MTGQEIGWNFLKGQGIDEKGFNIAAIDTFGKYPIQSLGREMCQNSLDAGIKDKKVRVEFELTEINCNKIPGYENLKQSILDCKNQSEERFKDSNDDDNQTHIANMCYEAINKEKIKVLRISDYNTKGALGVKSSCKTNSQFRALTRSEASSCKDATSGGSKGLGKNVIFAVSECRTAFVSTYNIDNERGTIGITKLMTVIEDAENEIIRDSVGYYSKNIKKEPIDCLLDILPAYKRKTNDYGTDIYIIAPNLYFGWEKELILNIIDSFLKSIEEDKLEVIVNKTLINKDNLTDVILSLQDKNGEDKFTNSVLSRCELMNDPDASIKYASILDQNDLLTKVYFLNENSSNIFPTNSFAIYRNGMKIKEISKRKIGGISVLFVGICCICGENLNKLLRKSENAEHTEWSDKHINLKPEERKQVKMAIKKINEALAKHLDVLIFNFEMEKSEEMSKKLIPDIMKKEGVSEFLSISECCNAKIATRKTGTVVKRNKSKKQAKKIISKKITTKIRETKKVVENKRKSINNDFTFKFINNSLNENTFLIVSPDKTGIYDINIFEAGVLRSEDIPMKILSATLNDKILNFNDNSLVDVELKKGERNLIVLRFESNKQTQRRVEFLC